MSVADFFPILGALLLPDLLSSDTMLQVEPPKRSDCNSLVGKLTMKEDSSELECLTCHKLQGLTARQPVDVLLVKCVYYLLWREYSSWLGSLPAYMLYRIVWDT